MTEVRCAAPGGTDVAEGRRLRHGQTADVDPVRNRAKIDAGLLVPLETVSDGKTIDDVLGWVDGDPDRARDALSAELASRRPRSTLVAQLEQLAAANDNDTSNEEE